jgi:hypothetical protein
MLYSGYPPNILKKCTFRQLTNNMTITHGQKAPLQKHGTD